MTIALNDLQVPQAKAKLLKDADKKVADQVRQFQRGLISEEELYLTSVKIWEDVSDKMTKIIEEALPSYGSIYLMAQSGAKGNIAQVKQMAGMRGLMTDPRGRIIDLPIRVQLQGRPVGVGIFHLHPRRPQGAGRYCATDRR